MIYLQDFALVCYLQFYLLFAILFTILMNEYDMKKIISLFQRNYEGDRLVRNEIVPGAEWVIAGEGVATRKYDGTSCMVRNGKLFKRFDAKAGRITPENFEPAQATPDVKTGHFPGWVPVGDASVDAYYREAVMPTENGTYELCGPKIQGNPEGYPKHVLIRHGSEILHNCPRTFDGLREYLAPGEIEGVVWWHPDGRMVKIKARDFGIKRRNSKATS
ncbi:MAG: RNA ligase [Podoviridae sp. cty5g4]|nr:MAG: RNA ligase [Podoviridae sp. cty5g4]